MVPEESNIEKLLAAKRESLNIEYKGSAPWDSLCYKLIRTVMAMANTRRGGNIVIGVEDGTFHAAGVHDIHGKTFPSEEKFLAKVNAFSDPHVQFQFSKQTHGGKDFWVATVPESDHIPVFCTRSEKNILKRGAVYVRSTRIPETVAIHSPTPDDLRNLIDLAVRKRTTSFTRRATTSVNKVLTDEDWTKGTISQTPTITIPYFEEDSYISLLFLIPLRLLRSSWGSMIWMISRKSLA